MQFVVFSRSASTMRVLLYGRSGDREPTEIIEFDPELNRWGDIWSVFVPGIGSGQLYHFQADGPHEPEKGQRFDGRARLIDPYAKALAGRFLPADDGVIRPPKCVVVDDQFDWQGDRNLRRPLSETIIYELHVRGFTRDRSSGVKPGHRGTYLGLMEKIAYLESLGVTAVELMPVHEFPIYDFLGRKPQRGYDPHYWGYNPLAFFAPHRGYAVGGGPGCQVRQFKELVRELHRAGIEVILDVVFNHTAEGNESGPTLSFKGLENRVYYMLKDGGRGYRNYSGCGNTLNGNHPIVRELIFHCLRHWVHNYHVDGFRFDLASILSRDREGKLVANPPVVEAIAEDPLLADTKIIAEAWDSAGAYQVGTFADLRWAEWNGRYRDDLRRFWRGEAGMVGRLATRLAGSSDLYQGGGRRPYHSINFITSHDGFTLNDLVSYEKKHNEANREANRDGEQNNYSCNYGVEGQIEIGGSGASGERRAASGERRAAKGDPQATAIESIRLRQIKNFLASLLLSQGVPMLLAGDECRRSQRGNNNAYCQDNAISWFDWKLLRQHAGLVRFCRLLIAFRKAEPGVRRLDFLDLPDASWYNAAGEPIDWDRSGHSLTYLLAAPESRGARGEGRGAGDEGAESSSLDSGLSTPDSRGHHLLMVMFHAGSDAQRFTIPEPARRFAWRQFINTAAESPADIYLELLESQESRAPDSGLPALDFQRGPAPPQDGVIELEGRSLVCYVARDE